VACDPFFTAYIAGGITVVVICMCGLGNLFCVGVLTTGAGITQFSQSNAISLLGDNTSIPGMAGGFFVSTDITDTFVGLCIQDYPIGITVSLGRDHVLFFEYRPAVAAMTALGPTAFCAAGSLSRTGDRSVHFARGGYPFQNAAI
jgi:hypothetical protein